MEWTGPFRMTDALRRIFAIAFGDLRVLLPLVFLVLLPQFLLSGAMVVSMWGDPERMFAQSWVLSLVQVPVSLVLKQLAVAAVIPLVFARLRGEPPGPPGRAVRQAARRLVPLVGLALLVGLASMAGLMACFVPGVILYCALFVATPALMVEETGVMDAWNRSFELTRGYRWEVFGVVFVLWAIGAVFGFAVAGAMPFLLEDPEGFMRTYLLVTTGVGLLSALVDTLLSAVASTVVYHDLRLAREGLGEDELVAVFA